TAWVRADVVPPFYVETSSTCTHRPPISDKTISDFTLTSGSLLPFSGKRQHNLPEAGVGLHTLMRVANLIHCIHTVDHRPNPPVRDQRQNGGRKATDRVGFLFDRARAKRRPDNGCPLPHDQAEIDVGFRAGSGADTDNSTTYRKPFQTGRKIIAANEVDNDINAAAIRPLVYRLHKFLRRLRNSNGLSESQFQVAHPIDFVDVS